MSLNLNPTPPVQSGAYHTSPAFNDAVNDSQLIRTFSIVALIGSILIFIGGAVGIGIGAALIGLGGTRYYKILGIAVIALSGLSYFLGPFGIIASSVMAVGILWRGIEVLGTLAAEGKGDPDWQPTRQRTILSIVLSSLAIVANAVWMTVMLVSWFWVK